MRIIPKIRIVTVLLALRFAMITQRALPELSTLSLSVAFCSPLISPLTFRLNIPIACNRTSDVVEVLII